MHVNATSMTVSDYCQGMERKEIIVNRQYQRSDRVWPPAARSYLIESVIQGFPLPKFTLYLITDLKSKKTIKEIVDGQQRSLAIYDFYSDKFVLSGSLQTEALRGRRFSELDEAHQAAFITATLSIDQLLAGEREDVREAFRRMNSYTIPLNPEEHRHAEFQGLFKWFVHRLADRYNGVFVRIGLFTEKQVVRMVDTKLLAEICDVLIFGIRTTNKKILDTLYRDREKQFLEEAEYKELIANAIDELQSWSFLQGTALMKPYIIYSLLLAIIHTKCPVASLSDVFRSPGLGEFDSDLIMRNLLALSEALETPDAAGGFPEFVAACTSKTNVRDQRQIRFLWMCNALMSDLT